MPEAVITALLQGGPVGLVACIAIWFIRDNARLMLAREDLHRREIAATTARLEAIDLRWFSWAQDSLKVQQSTQLAIERFTTLLEQLGPLQRLSEQLIKLEARDAVRDPGR